ncbi:MAG: helix-turn-helix transcriptional regulator [Alphaproteobacteria bacterium]|nr:helix-turn-helix transcriptional regulator [Alphaproteobacteria bacterium]
MVELQSAHLDQVFHALSDPTRRGMLRTLAGGERSISDLAAPFAMTLAGASKHLRMLEEARLVRREKRGRTHFCRLEPRALAEADEWLAFYRHFWSARLDALEAELLKPEPKALERKKK